MQRNRRQIIIPVDKAVKEFAIHLNSHPRTLLSARFGDGKSFFLAEAAKILKKRYCFITVYPVNYQVAGNKDIFEYIKRDILIQLYYKNMIPDSYELPDDVAAIFFLRNNWKEYAEEFLKTLSELDSSNTIKTVLGAAKFLQALKKKYDSFKNNGGDLASRLDRFIEQFDSSGIYEEDLITTIISDIIKNWKKAHPRKKVCLVFEDMDRIEPAHIFRILNVISSQMDYGYKYGYSPNSCALVGNKFGVDNVAVCLDYDNLKSIYHHFYGLEACFDGYINKFCDRGIFRYSLHEYVKTFYTNELIRVTGMNEDSINTIMKQIDITPFTLRQLYHAIDGVENQVSLPKSDSGVISHRGLYYISVVLRRLGYSSDKIINVLSNAFKDQPMTIASYAATSMMLKRDYKHKGFIFTLGEKKDGAYLIQYSVKCMNPDGTVSLERQYLGSWDSKMVIISPEEEMQFIINNVAF